MKRRLGVIVSILLAALASSWAGTAAAQEAATMDPAIVARLGAALAGYRVAEPPLPTRGGPLTDLYWSNVQNAPVVVVDGGTGSATVIIVNPNRQAYVLTNHHVAAHAFTQKEHPPGVFLLFYNAALKNEMFDPDRFLACFKSSPGQTEWCRAVRSSFRWASVIGSDPTRDLALLSVDDVPAGVAGIPPANMQALQPGDQVAIIGTPKHLLWTLTAGIISAVRTKFTLGTGSGTIIQTQAPMNPGNSGGPLITSNRSLAGVVFGSRVGETFMIGNEQVQVPAEGLNYAIGIDQVLAFTRNNLPSR